MTPLRVLVDSTHPQWALALRMAGFDAVETAWSDGGDATGTAVRQDQADRAGSAGDRADLVFVDATGSGQSGHQQLEDRLRLAADHEPGTPVVVCAPDLPQDQEWPVTLVRPPLTAESLASVVRQVVGHVAEAREAAAPADPSCFREDDEPTPTAKVPRGKPWSRGAPRDVADRDPLSDLEAAHAALVLTRPPRVVLAQLVEEVARSCGADVAVLRPAEGHDGSRDPDHDVAWDVVGGVGLRAIELRSLAALPDAVRALDARRAVLSVAETDSLRSSLAGFPLARHRSLLVVRHPHDLVVSAGRDTPFGAPEVRLLVDAMHDALPDLLRGWQVEHVLSRLVDWLEG